MVGRLHGQSHRLRVSRYITFASLANSDEYVSEIILGYLLIADKA